MRKDREDRDSNEGDYVERPYYDSEQEKEELEKVPVEYLGHLQKKRIFRLEQFMFWSVLWILVLGFGPGIQGQKLDTRSGQIKTYYTFIWGHWRYEDPPEPTEWTTWYDSLNPEPYEEHWVDYGIIYPALFGHLTSPWGENLGWVIPPITIERMKELENKLRAGLIMKIPRILNSVNTGAEWNAIIVPLCQGTVDDAYTWWNDNEERFAVWSMQPWGTPMPAALIEESNAYIEKMNQTDENLIPIMPN
ncbi:MAG: hypothetical protein NTY09_08750 [bacterium]|nr:hypothetical protein [bacterium]